MRNTKSVVKLYKINGNIHLMIVRIEPFYDDVPDRNNGGSASTALAGANPSCLLIFIRMNTKSIMLATKDCATVSSLYKFVICKNGEGP